MRRTADCPPIGLWIHREYRGNPARVHPIGPSESRPGATVRADLLAAAMLAIVTIPQAMAYALLAGLPPAVGLRTAAAAGVGYALLGSSRQLSVGPMAIVCLLVHDALRPFAALGAAKCVEVGSVLAVLVAGALGGLVLLRAGIVARVLVGPVMIGFVAAAALRTVASQLPALVGQEGGLSWAELDAVGVAVGAVSVALLVVLPRWRPRLPAPLVLCWVVPVGVWALDASVATVGPVPSGVPALVVPRLEGALLVELLPSAVTIAVIGFATSIMVGQALARDPRGIRADRELGGLGLANLASALVGGFPVAASLSRSVVNAAAGARTRWAAAGAGILVLGASSVLAPLLVHLPLAVLAAIVVVSAGRLVKVESIVPVLRAGWPDRAALVATFVTSLWIGLDWGLAAAVVAGGWLRRLSLPPDPPMSPVGRSGDGRTP